MPEVNFKTVPLPGGVYVTLVLAMAVAAFVGMIPISNLVLPYSVTPAAMLTSIVTLLFTLEVFSGNINILQGARGAVRTGFMPNSATGGAPS